MLAFIGPSWQWIILLVIVLLIFGNRIPGIARSLGSGITEFKKGLKDGDGDKNKELPESPEQPKP
jgi:sec-independent protein translocase protein TatA